MTQHEPEQKIEQIQAIPPGALLALADLDFLKAVVARYPEVNYLAGEAAASPEGLAKLKADALAYAAFGKTVVIHPTAIEADRSFLGLLTFKWVMTGDYAQFTSLQNNPATKLSRASFDKLADYTRGVAASEDDIEFCLYSLACNDLGKTRYLEARHQEVTGRAAEDHDQLLAGLMTAAPALFPAFTARFSEAQQQSYIAGLKANLNLGQFVQGENFPVNLCGMQALDAKSRDLRLVCELFDFAGVTGHVDARGSAVMTEQNYQAFSAAIEALTLPSPNQAYRHYMAQRGAGLGIAADTAEGFALCRIAALARAFDAAQGAAIRTAFAALPEPERNRLIAELNVSGLEDKKGILIYYAPALIANALISTGSLSAALAHALPLLAEIYTRARAKHDTAGNGVFTVNIADAARQALQLTTQEAALPNSSPKNDTLDFPGTRLAFIGGGGGSDCIQAAILALLTGKPACALSVRTDKTQSQGSTGAIGEKRAVHNHGGEVAPGVFRMRPETSGSGRFLENIPAGLLPVYLVIDSRDGRLQSQLQAALDDFGGVDTVIDVDTGGDCLYRSGVVTEADKATPDQDLETLNAVSGLRAAHRLSCVIAKGVDSPDDADAVLAAAKARAIEFSPQEKERILALYKTFELDGSNPERYGKTPFAWQAALRGETGPVRLPLPDKVVNDAKNPWNPVVNIKPDMAGGYVMTVEDHLRAIAAPREA